MKTQNVRFPTGLLRVPRLKRRDFFLTLIPGLAWLVLVQARPWTIHSRCVAHADLCPASAVNLLDQSALGLDSTPADEYSYFLQNTSGALGVILPLALHLWPAGAGIGAAATDMSLLFQTAFWNGTATELAHVAFPRARPFLYAHRGESSWSEPQNFTSFFSGHTSFVTAVQVGLFLMFLGRGAPVSFLIFYGFFAECMILSTAFFRILAGRHFVTDVLAGAVSGCLVALAVAWKARSAK